MVHFSGHPGLWGVVILLSMLSLWFWSKLLCGLLLLIVLWKPLWWLIRGLFKLNLGLLLVGIILLCGLL